MQRMPMEALLPQFLILSLLPSSLCHIWLRLLIFLYLHLKPYILIAEQLEGGEYKLSAINVLTGWCLSLSPLKKGALHSISEDFPATISSPVIVKCKLWAE